jgi:hypothetical protein
MAPFFCRRNERRTYSEANAARQPWNQDGGGTGREESPATGSAHKFTRANDSKALAALLRNFLAATSVSLISRGETKRFAGHGASHWNPYRRRIRPFAESFVFSGLSPISFRRFHGLFVFNGLASLLVSPATAQAERDL